MGDSVRLEIVVVDELLFYFDHDLNWHIVLVNILELAKEVFLIHELLGGVPPVFFELLGVFLLWRLFNFAV